ncbi:MAG: hypothetical protein V2A65_01465 [Candidatus Omnitrophota bacterium]
MPYTIAVALLFTIAFSPLYSYSQEKLEKPTAAVLDLISETPGESIVPSRVSTPTGRR